MVFESVEPVVPGSALIVDPGAQQRQLIDSQPTRTPGALTSLLDQATPSQDTDVVRDGLLSQVERRGELPHRGVTAGQTGHQSATHGIPQGSEGGAKVRPGYLQ